MDENLGQREAVILRAAGHDVMTVHEQRLQTTADRDLLDLCAAEGRCLLTLDLDFANPLQFDPTRFAGICVVRQTHREPVQSVIDSVKLLAETLLRRNIAGQLWIVTPRRIRQYTGKERR